MISCSDNGLRVLCYVNHYFEQSGNDTPYLSCKQAPEIRRAYVLKTLEQLRQLNDIDAIQSFDLYVCGANGRSLVPVDIDLSLVNARMLIFESLALMATHVDEYDYFLNVEDDLLVSPDVVENILEYDRQGLVNECLHPNRVEVRGDSRVLLDPMHSERVWTYQEKQFNDVTIRVSANPHAGFLMFSRQKFRYCLSNIDPTFRGTVVGGPMASAYAHFHKPFALFRPYGNLHFHALIHQDRHHPCWGDESGGNPAHRTNNQSH